MRALIRVAGHSSDGLLCPHLLDVLESEVLRRSAITLQHCLSHCSWLWQQPGLAGLDQLLAQVALAQVARTAARQHPPRPD